MRPHGVTERSGHSYRASCIAKQAIMCRMSAPRVTMEGSKEILEFVRRLHYW